MPKFTSTFNPFVVMSSLICCITILMGVLFSSTFTETALHTIKEAIFTHFSWLYILTSAFFIFFLLFLILSRYGDIKLGENKEIPQFNLAQWFSLLFTAGMGIGIIFLGVAEPISHFLSPINPTDIEKSAIFQSIFHWSINAWAIYGLIALTIAYFGFRYKLPLSLRSCFYPFLKHRIEGKIGDFIDILGLCTTLFGVITTLAYSAVRLSTVFTDSDLLIQDNSIIHLIFASVFIFALLFSMNGIGKGLRILSEINLSFSLILMSFVLIVGPTAYLLSTFTENIGHYLNSVIGMGLKTYIYEPKNQRWFTNWTILYWAWWFSWAPAFGIFIARISKGRTIREFIFGVLIVPSLFFILWFTIFGNGAIWVNEHIAAGHLGDFINQSGKLLFVFLDYLPFSLISKSLALVIILLFFITTIDFGIYILNNIASKDKSQVSPHWQSIMWGAIMALMTFVLFQFGGISAVQNTMLMFSLPFAILMIIMAFSLLKGLRADYVYYHTQLNSPRWTGDNWKTQLEQLLHQNEEKEALRFLKQIALPAMRELRQELIGLYDFSVHLQLALEAENPQITLSITLQNAMVFDYSISVEAQQSTENTAPIYQLIAHTPNEETCYDIAYLDKNGVIADILKHYEIYQRQSFIHAQMD